MEQKYLITPNFIRENSNLSINIDDKYLANNIIFAQDIDFQQIVGTVLYDYIIDQCPSFNENVTTLMNKYGYYYILHATIYRSLLSLNYKVNEVGITKQNSENSTNLELNEFNNLRQEYKNNMEFYGERLRLYLLDNEDIYTQYCDNDDISKIKPTKSYFSGFQFDTSSNC